MDVTEVEVERGGPADLQARVLGAGLCTACGACDTNCKSIRDMEVMDTILALRAHLVVLGGIAVVGGAVGWLLQRYTSAVFPYTDSWVTVASVVTTYMVARKVMENWPYWLVIDSVSLYLYLLRGLNLYAVLFALYLVLVIVGWLRWEREWRVRHAVAS